MEVFFSLLFQEATPEPQQNKYTVKPRKKLQSHFLLQQQMKKKDKEAALILEQQKVSCSSDREL